MNINKEDVFVNRKDPGAALGVLFVMLGSFTTNYLENNNGT